MPITLSERFPYLNDKIHKINKFTIKHPNAIPEHMLNTMNMYIVKSNICNIPKMPELDKLYKNIRIDKQMLIPKRINANMDKLMLKAYLDLHSKYHANGYVENIFALYPIWEYLPRYLQRELKTYFESVLDMTSAELLEFNMDLRDLRMSLNPFVISNELDKLISLKNEL